MTRDFTIRIREDNEAENKFNKIVRRQDCESEAIKILLEFKEFNEKKLNSNVLYISIIYILYFIFQ